MGSLTSNLHLVMNTFYKPTATRYKILCEAKAFPSDQVSRTLWLVSALFPTAAPLQYAFASQAALHGFDPKEAVLELSPRQGEYTLRTGDILKTITDQGDQVALVLFSGVQYYTGQLFQMGSITQAAKAKVRICELTHL